MLRRPVVRTTGRGRTLEYRPPGWRTEPSLLDNAYVKRLESVVTPVTGSRPRYCGGTAGLDKRFFMNDFTIPPNIRSFNESMDTESI
ncbi:MAG: hypothetical protein QXW76_06405 [Candidatus Korarchaeum sp.]